MLVIKRNGKEVEFDATKISNAIQGANKEVKPMDRLPDEVVECIVESITDTCKTANRSVSVEEIQDLVEAKLMKYSYNVAEI